MNLAAADKLAAKIIAELEVFCDPAPSGTPRRFMIEVAGSIRRKRPFVNDLDLVLLPLAPLAIRERLRRNCEIVTDGPQNVIARFPAHRPRESQTQLDLFFARPEQRDLLSTTPTNWGSILLCRTGSKEHNIWLIERAKQLGLRWNPYHGVFDQNNNLLASATEEDIFRILELEYIPPEKRER
jgi:DNA polymerase (family 10)